MATAKEDKYLPDVNTRRFIIDEQINEARKIIFRNDLENLAFKANGEKNRVKEVEANKEILAEKIDLLLKEREKYED